MNTQTAPEAVKTVDALDLERRVKAMYRDVALNPHGKYHFELGRTLAERLGYPSDNLDRIPPQAIESFAGVGYYFDLADLEPGEHVLDLGSGSGMDVFFAASKVGPGGRVTGVDMSPEQLEKSDALRREGDWPQVSFLDGHIEDLSVDDGTVDAVISNGVINLSSDKASVFREAARVLRPGGRLAIADIVSLKELPENISCDATLWAACIGGALQVDRYYYLIEEAGLDVMQMKKNPYSFLSGGARGATDTYGIMSVSLLAVKRAGAS